MRARRCSTGALERENERVSALVSLCFASSILWYVAPSTSTPAALEREAGRQLRQLRRLARVGRWVSGCAETSVGAPLRRCDPLYHQCIFAHEAGKRAATARRNASYRRKRVQGAPEVDVKATFVDGGRCASFSFICAARRRSYVGSPRSISNARTRVPIRRNACGRCAAVEVASADV